MRAAEVIATLQQRGVTLKMMAGSLKIGGAEKLTAREKAALRAHKASILRALELSPQDATATKTPEIASLAVTEPLPSRTTPPEPGSTTPFGQPELDAINAGSGCWVWSGVLSEWLFWVRDEECRRKAIGKGIDAWRIWTLAELTGAQGLRDEELRHVAALKRKFTGTVQPGWDDDEEVI